MDSMILADQIKIHQIIMNLATNAFHAMEDKGGTLGIELKEIMADEELCNKYIDFKIGKYLRLTISDTGIGMNEQTIDRIFEPFFTTKEEGKGTGMGLSVVHGIVKSHDGVIHVKSEVGKGTKFDIYFPVIESNQIKTIENNLIKISKGNENIMVVDDRKYICTMLNKMLSGYGYNVHPFYDSEAALEAYKKHPEKYDLVITDRTMPNLSGLELAKYLKEFDETIPIMIVTGQSHNLTPKILKEYGIDKLVQKPIMLEEILNSINKIFEG